MRVAARLLLVVGLVLVVSGTAGAVTVPALNLFNFLEMTDHSNGDVYLLGLIPPGNPGAGTPEPVGTFVWDAGDNRWEPQGVDREAGLVIIPPEGGVPNEDTWGVFAWKILRPGNPSPGVPGAEKMDATPGGIPTYQWSQAPGAAGTGIVGIYYGGQDVEVTIRADGSFVVKAEDVQADVWAVDSTLLGYDWDGTLNSTGDFTIAADHEGPRWDPVAEAGRRTDQRHYENWVDADFTVGVDAIPLFHGQTTYFLSDGVFDGTYFNGGITAYFEADNGVEAPGFWIWNAFADQDIFTDPDGNVADLWLDLENVDDGGYEWLTKSNDDGGFAAVPEPITMLGVIIGAGSIGGYIRKRRIN